ncbi:glycosyltransferase family 2 protein [Kineococcus endophyticus]|uniref:4,4'-diaponeurosporenoate glycosyltransferase n=1 Tax=Kineococcus endophyticus TaxID=1181883 RepID=A0ABV3P8D9_9ACTN
MSPNVSVIVRTRNSAATLPATLSSLRSQTVPVRVVVVDSGSTDATVSIARDDADQLVQVPGESFSYGGALNTGAEAAPGPVQGSLSSHTVLPRPDWVEIALSHLDAGAVAVCGGDVDGGGRPLRAPLSADAEYLSRHRYWGFTNTASLWRADVRSAHPFDETLVASEDQEWSWRVVADGGVLVVDPRLTVSGSHRRTAGLKAYHQRMVREIRALEHLRPLAHYPLWQGVADWVRSEPVDPFVSRVRPFGRTRLLDIAARWDAGRQQRHGKVPQPRTRHRASSGNGEVRADV